jgi:hypothetical protein
MRAVAARRNISSKEIALNVSPDANNDAVSIFVSQDLSPTVTWILQVYAQTSEGKFRVGDLVLQPVYSNTTTPPTAGDPPARIVGMGYFPGVEAWSVVPRGIGTDQGQPPTIDIYLMSSPAPASAPVAGVFAVEQGGQSAESSILWRDVGTTIANPPTNSVAIPDLNFGGDPKLTLRNARGGVDGLVLGVPLTVQFFDQATAPVAGDIPFARYTVTLEAPNWAIDFRPRGHPLATGNLAFGVSAQFATYAAPAANQVSDANLEFGI